MEGTSITRQKLLSWSTTLFILVSLLAGVFHTAAAQRTVTTIKMDVWAAFDGHFKYGEWLPLYVQLENSGTDVNAEVQVRVAGRGGVSVFAAPADLPTGSRKQITLYVLPNSFTHTLEVQLISSNQVLLSETVSIKAQPNINYLVGVIAPERGALSLLIGTKLPGMPRKNLLVDGRLTDLPDKVEGLRSFDTLIINDVDTSTLTPSQKTAMEAWVRQGGRLIIGGGAGALKSASGLPAELLPLTPRNFQEVDQLEGLTDLGAGEDVRVPGPFIAAVGNQVNGRILAQQGDLPLVVEKSVGSGYVDFIALDLTVSPFNAWAGAAAFWETLLAPNSAYPEWMPPDMSKTQMTSSRMTYALSNLPAMDLPSVRGLALLLGFYIALVGPINYLLLRWQRRLHWAWVTIPMITVIFSAGAFGLGYVMRGTDLLLNRIVVAELNPGGSANVMSFYGLFSPAQSSYEVEVSGGGLLRSLTADYDPWRSSIPAAGAGEVVFYQGEPNRLRGLSVNQWSMQSFMSETTWQDFGTLHSDLVLDQQKLVGTVRNETGIYLNNVVLILGNQISFLGDLAPGQEAQVSMEVMDLIGQPFGNPLSYRIFEQEFSRPMPSGPSRDLQMKQSIIDGLVQWGSGFTPVFQKSTGESSWLGANAFLIGWFSEAPDEVKVGGRLPAQTITGLLYSQIPIDLVESDRLYVPPGLIAGNMVQMPVDGGYCGSTGGTYVYIGRGQAVSEFKIPEIYQDMQIEKLTLYIGTDGGWNRVPETSIFDWDAQDWEIIDRAQTGQNAITFEDRYMGSGHTVRFQLSTVDGFSGGCYYLGLGLDGVR
jgi:hypothetical protein